MKTRFRIAIAAAVSIMMMGTAKLGAQMVSSHAPALGTAKSAPRAGTATMTPGIAVSGKPVARVNGVELMDRDLLREMYTIFPYAQQHNGFPKQLEPEIRRGALQMMIFEELVYQEAKRRKMTIPSGKLAAAETAFRKQFPSSTAYQDFLKTEVNGSEAAMREKIKRSLLIDSLLNQDVIVPSVVTTAQARAEYVKNSAQYKHGEIIHIQSISIIPPNESKAVLEEAKERAAEALRQAKQAKTYRDFGLLAEKMSDDDFHVNMGDHKPQDASKLPPQIVKAAAKMKPGEVSELIQLGNYYTIFRLQARTPAGTTPFAEVKAKLQSELQKKNTEQLRSALAQKLRKNAKIETL
ncbi:MAG TPA: peptidylprolyl isomerase [Terriglobales bacterium]|nr:peptidylprolyl isomerase [Terriglobales bacterium]